MRTLHLYLVFIWLFRISLILFSCYFLTLRKKTFLENPLSKYKFHSQRFDDIALCFSENSKINLLDRVSRTDSNDDSLAAIDGSTEDEDEELHFNSAVYDSNHKVSHRRPLPKDMPSQDQVRENPTLLKAMLLQLSSSSTDDDFLRMNAVSQADGDGLICWPDIRLIEADMATPHPQALLMPSYRNSTYALLFINNRSFYMLFHRYTITELFDYMDCSLLIVLLVYLSHVFYCCSLRIDCLQHVYECYFR